MPRLRRTSLLFSPGQLLLGGVLLGAGYAAWNADLFEYASPERVRATVAAAGIAGPLIFIALLIPLNVFFLAGPPIWISATLWPTPLAVTYSIIGAVVASIGTYALARQLGRDWARSKIPARVRRYEDRLERNPVRMVATMRLVFWLNPGIDLLLAVSRVRRRDYVLATLVGMVPFTALRVVIGEKGVRAAAVAPQWFWPSVAAALAAALALRCYKVRARRAAIAKIAAWAGEASVQETAQEQLNPES